MNTQQVLSKVNLNGVTSEQIGRCYLVINPDGERVYKVENERGELNEQGEIKEYTVSYKNGCFFCTCDAGKEGFAHCHKYGVCKHVIWSLAAAREERTALAEQAHKANEQAREFAAMVAKQSKDAGYSRALEMAHW